MTTPRDATVRATDLVRLGERLRALAEPNRLRVFALLMDGTRCNCELGEALDLAPNLLSHHLSALRAAGLVEATRDPADARWVHYAVNRATLAELHAALGAFFDPARLGVREPSCAPRRTAPNPRPSRRPRGVTAERRARRGAPSHPAGRGG